VNSPAYGGRSGYTHSQTEAFDDLVYLSEAQTIKQLLEIVCGDCGKAVELTPLLTQAESERSRALRRVVDFYPELWSFTNLYKSQTVEVHTCRLSPSHMAKLAGFHGQHVLLRSRYGIFILSRRRRQYSLLLVNGESLDSFETRIFSNFGHFMARRDLFVL